MSDEEKKAIERIQRLVKYFEDWEAEVTVEPEDKKYFDTILNLIKKQSKEIEELKEKDTANLAYYDQIYQNGIYTGQRAVEDKIKARIEELEGFLYKGNIKDDFLMIRIKAKIQELQSFLEKE